MNRFKILANDHLSISTDAFYHLPYTGMNNLGNPDYLNKLKNTYNSFLKNELHTATQSLRLALNGDLPQILRLLKLDSLTVCVVPRAKSEVSYHANQQLFRSTVQTAVGQLDGFFDGTNYIRRHTNTKTTHLRKPIPNYNNDGFEPYPGITEATCEIAPDVRGKSVLLVDDIYTPGVNVDEDAINALLNAGANTVIFYAIGKV